MAITTRRQYHGQYDHQIMCRFGLTLMVLLLGIFFTFRAYASDNVLHRGNKTLLVMGDSLSAGYGVKIQNAWVTQLQNKLMAEAYPLKVVNASVSGETTAGGLSRLLPLLRRHRPAIMVLELGANDGLRGLPIKQMHANLQRMITLSEQTGAKVLLLGMQLPPNYGPTYTKSFADTYQQLSESNSIDFLPFFLQGVTEKRDLMQADDLHPNDKAQSLILDNVWPVIKRVIKQAGISPTNRKNAK